MIEMLSYLTRFAIVLAVLYICWMAPGVWVHGFGKVKILLDIGVAISLAILVGSHWLKGIVKNAFVMTASVLLLAPFATEIWANFSAAWRGEFDASTMFYSPFFYVFAIITALLCLLAMRSLQNILALRRET